MGARPTLSRYSHVCTSHGVALPAMRKAAAAEHFAARSDAQLAKGRQRPRATKVSRYVERRAPAVSRGIAAILRRHGQRVAAAIRVAVRKDDSELQARLLRIIEELNLDDLGEDLEGELVEAMLAAFKRAAAVGLTEVGLAADADITAQLDEAALDYARERGGELIKDLAGTTEEAIEDAIARGVEDGMSVAMLADEIEKLGAFGPARAETIARTELAYAHVRGNVEGWRASGEVEGKRWLLADTHPEPDECDDAAEAGVVGLEDDFVDGIKFPPAHPNCCLPGTVVAPAGRIAAHFGRRFHGEVVSISTARSDLTVTLNHPVLTLRGWVAAGALQVGDRVLECRDPAAAATAIEPDNHDVPARIEDVPRALLMAGGMATAGMPATAEAFHGDGMVDGEVDVVWAAGALKLDGQAGRLKRGVHSLLGFGHGGRRALAGQGAKALLGQGNSAPAHGSMGSGGPGLPHLGRELGIDQQPALARVAHRQAVALERVAQGRTVAPDGSRKLDGGLAGHVAGMDSGEFAGLKPATQRVDRLRPSNFDTLLAQKSLNDLVRDAQLSREAADRLAGLVASAEITQLSRRQFNGTVHNISTRNGWYFADGIVVHNCLCDVLPVLREPGEGED